MDGWVDRGTDGWMDGRMGEARIDLMNRMNE